MPLLQVIVCSTRPGRIGLSVSQWFERAAREHGRFDVELVDLADVDLPVFNEPEHPRFKKYLHAHTRRWSQRVDRADAFVFVTPEYNFGPPPAFVNAVNYLVHEWAYKPAGFVSYGGVSGGLRAVQMEKQILSTLKVVPLLEAVVVPMANQQVSGNEEVRVFTGNELQSSSAIVMLDELAKWTDALRQMRAPSEPAAA